MQKVESRNGTKLRNQLTPQKCIRLMDNPTWFCCFFGTVVVPGIRLICSHKHSATRHTTPYTGWPKKVSHYRESSLNRIKNRQPG